MIMEKLKAATRNQHEILENTVDVMNQMFNLNNYQTLLLKFYRFYSALEPELAGFELKKYGYDLTQRLKTPKLEKDLSDLGIFDQTKKISAWDELPQLNTAEQAFGALYVIEGATLGGQIISRHLKHHLHIIPEKGGSFFNGYGEKTGLKWKEFTAAATDFAFAANNDEEIVQSAKDTFESFRNCFLDPISLNKSNY